MKQSILSKDGVSYVVPFVLITSCFALWGFANDITNPMVKAFSKIFRMSATDGAMVQVAFNFGNAIGAFAGGIPISLGMPIQTTALVGLFFVLIAVAGYIWFCHRYEKR